MKKLVAACLFVALVLSTGQVFANLDDNRASIAAKYGEYRLVVDEDGQLWTKADWEGGGSVKAKAGSFVYYFTRNGVNIQMEVLYDSKKAEALVKSQRITPDVAIKIQDFKDYFPEINALVTGPKAEAFATSEELTRNFRDAHSPVTMGVVIKSQIIRTSSYPLLAFNIKDDGRLIRDAKYIGKGTYIHEFTLERISSMDVDDPYAQKDWEWLKNPFK
ncbi:MAG: hypothetical protein P4N59_24955 [Negativicutes bacterium]|nr:hypothetical protein [Negativicutes bacterium]